MVIPIDTLVYVPLWYVSCQMPSSVVGSLFREVPGRRETLGLYQYG